MFRGHIGREIRARAVFMSEISGHGVSKTPVLKLHIIYNGWKRQINVEITGTSLIFAKFLFLDCECIKASFSLFNYSCDSHVPNISSWL